MSFTSVDFPAPETPVTAASTPSGNSTSMLRRLFSLAPAILRLPVGASSFARYFDTFAAREVGAGERLPGSFERLWCARVNDPAAGDARARAEVDDMVGRANGVFVVFDDDDGVPDVAHSLEGREQALVVALVQPDRRFVEDVDDAGQLGADLTREADALRFAARERRTRSVEREVAEPDGETRKSRRPRISFRTSVAICAAAPFEREFAEELHALRKPCSAETSTMLFAADVDRSALWLAGESRHSVEHECRCRGTAAYQRFARSDDACLKRRSRRGMMPSQGLK